MRSVFNTVTARMKIEVCYMLCLAVLLCREQWDQATDAGIVALTLLCSAHASSGPSRPLAGCCTLSYRSRLFLFVALGALILVGWTATTAAKRAPRAAASSAATAAALAPGVTGHRRYPAAAMDVDGCPQYYPAAAMTLVTGLCGPVAVAAAAPLLATQAGLRIAHH